MSRSVFVHPSALERIRAMRGSARAIIITALKQLAIDGDVLETKESSRLRDDLAPLRKLPLGQMRIVFGFTADSIIILAAGDREAGKNPDFYGQLSERIHAGDFDSELKQMREYEATLATAQPPKDGEGS